MYLKYLLNAGDFSLHITDTLAGGEYWISNNYYQKKQSDWDKLFPHVHIWCINQNLCALVADLMLHANACNFSAK